MSRLCPETNDVVLYAACMECENRGRCTTSQVAPRIRQTPDWSAIVGGKAGSQKEEDGKAENKKM